MKQELGVRQLVMNLAPHYERLAKRTRLIVYGSKHATELRNARLDLREAQPLEVHTECLALEIADITDFVVRTVLKNIQDHDVGKNRRHAAQSQSLAGGKAPRTPQGFPVGDTEFDERVDRVIDRNLGRAVP